MRPAPWPLAALGLVLVSFAFAGCSASAPAEQTLPPVPTASSPGTSGAASPSAADDPVRDAAVRALLARRAQAFTRHDAAALRATDAPQSPAFTARDVATLDNLRSVPLASWTYVLDPAVPSTTRPRARTGVQASWAPSVQLRYELQGFDTRPTTLQEGFTFVERDRQWLLAADDDPGGNTARDLWDGGPVVVSHGTRSLVLSHPAFASLAPGIAAEVDRDIPDVTAIWGTDWSQRAVVLIPDDAAELARVVHTTADLSAYAAVQSAELGHSGNGSQTPVGDRVGINPTAYRAMSAPARRVLLTHELTHVASRADSGPDLPVWLVEGLADDVAFAPTGLTTRQIASSLAAEVAAGRVPTQLPGDSDFTGSDPRLSAVYNEAWTACRLIVVRVGQAGLVQLYRRLGTSTDAAAAHAEAAAFGAVLHETPAAFEQDWVAAVASGLAPEEAG